MSLVNSGSFFGVARAEVASVPRRGGEVGRGGQLSASNDPGDFAGLKDKPFCCTKPPFSGGPISNECQYPRACTGVKKRGP